MLSLEPIRGEKSVSRTYRVLAVSVLLAMSLLPSCQTDGTNREIETPMGGITTELGTPTVESTARLYDEMDLRNAVTAYIWGIPAAGNASRASSRTAGSAADSRSSARSSARPSSTPNRSPVRDLGASLCRGRCPESRDERTDEYVSQHVVLPS